MTLKITTEALQAAVAAVAAMVDVGDEGAAQLIVFSGPVPASIADPVGAGCDFLATFDLPEPAFGAPALVGNEVEALAFDVPDTEATAAGEASFFRVYDRDGDQVMQGLVGAAGSSADLILNQIDITVGAIVSVDRLVIGIPVT